MLVLSDKALFFLILGLRIFFQNIKVGGGKKIKIKITKKIFLFNLKHIWIGEKEITKIVIFFNILFFFLNLAVFYIRENKKSQKYFFFFLKCKNLGRRIRKPRNKKKSPNYSHAFLPAGLRRKVPSYRVKLL